MSGELTAADVSWRARSEGIVQDALRHATVTDSAVTVSEDGRTVTIVYLEVRLPDGRLVALSPPATVLEVSGRGNGWHNATVQQDFTEGS
jgi:hypothetical protein